jgi:hypothetical protein
MNTETTHDHEFGLAPVQLLAQRVVFIREFIRVTGYGRIALHHDEPIQ